MNKFIVAITVVMLFAACGDNETPPPANRGEACAIVAQVTCDKAEECSTLGGTRPDCEAFVSAICFLQQPLFDVLEDWETCEADINAMTCETMVDGRWNLVFSCFGDPNPC